ncbi:glycosyltransferase family 4 protein [Tardiphaga sp.]|uniref:glycosyltransferase family 4 protein n=1 Tax=Tardiphaga sp. TaxID=1926292 RepID=UPI00352B4E62
MKICYVINSLDGGGGALPVPNIVKVMRAAGHEVFVVALMERDGRARPALEAAATPYTVIGGARRAYVRTAVQLSGLVRGMAPDIIWTSLSHATITGQLVGKLHGIPVISWLHNAWLKPANTFIMRRTFELTRHWVADSEAVALFGQKVLGIPAERISIWPIFQADPAQPVARMAKPDCFRIGSLGRLHRNKGYDVLIEALALLRDRSPEISRSVRVAIGGDGPARADLERRVADLHLANIEFPGFVDPAPFLAGLNCYVQPSHHEGFCIAAHEAMCAGLPIVASPVGEMAHSVAKSQSGVLVDYGDIEGLSMALESLIRDPVEAARRGEIAREWAMKRYAPAAFMARGLNAISAAGLPVQQDRPRPDVSRAS